MAARVGLTAQRLTEGAAELADESGFENVTASALARRFGVSVASLYAHVRNLDELRVRVTALALTELAAREAEAIGGRAGKDALIALADAFRDYALDHPGRYAAAGARIEPGSVAAEPALRNSHLMRAVLRGLREPPGRRAGPRGAHDRRRAERVRRPGGLRGVRALGGHGAVLAADARRLGRGAVELAAGLTGSWFRHGESVDRRHGADYLPRSQLSYLT